MIFVFINWLVTKIVYFYGHLLKSLLVIIEFRSFCEGLGFIGLVRGLYFDWLVNFMSDGLRVIIDRLGFVEVFGFES
jgi:hypothetical protein